MVRAKIPDMWKTLCMSECNAERHVEMAKGDHVMDVPRGQCVDQCDMVEQGVQVQVWACSLHAGRTAGSSGNALLLSTQEQSDHLGKV